MTTKKQERVQVCALWKKTSKAGSTYFTGTMTKGGDTFYVTAFYNLKKKNPKEPDLRVYQQDAKGQIMEGSELDLWCNVSSAKNKKYLAGKVDGQKVVGFINEPKEGSKRPYITVYLSDERQNDQEPAPAPEKREKQQAQLDIATADLPF